MGKFIKYLEESVAITADNIDVLGKKASEKVQAVMATGEFAKVQELDPAFAKKLVIAWEGDLVELKKKGAGFESLVPKMLDAKNVERLSKLKLNDVKDAIDKLSALHAKSFASGKSLSMYHHSMNSDIWAHIRPVKEALEAAYEALRAEVDGILNEVR